MATKKSALSNYGTPVIVNSGSELDNVVSTGTGGVSGSNTGAIANNSSNKDLWFDAVLVTGTWGFNPSGWVSLYGVFATDGTNYDTADATESRWLCNFYVDPSTTSKRIVRRKIRFPGVLMKTFIVNYTDQPMPASGNSVTIYPYSTTSFDWTAPTPQAPAAADPTNFLARTLANFTLVGAGTYTSGGGGGGGATANSRPFATNSPWNTPIPGGTAWFDHVRLHQFTDGSLQHWYGLQPFGVVYANNSMPTWTFNMPDFVATDFNRNRPATTFTGVHAPADLATSGDVDHVLCVVQEDGSYIEMWQAQVDATNHVVYTNGPAGWATGNMITGTGCGGLVSSGGNNAGNRASNFSWAAGLLTGYDIAHGSIDHAIALALPGHMLDDRWMSYRSPATAWDNASGGLGPFNNGTLIGIPAGVSEPAGLSSLGHMMFVALQTYGAYVGDFVGGSWTAFYADRFTVSDPQIQPLYVWWGGGPSDTDRLVPLLRVANYQP